MNPVIDGSRSLQVARTAQHGRVLRQQMRLGGGGPFEVGVDAVDRFAVDGCVQRGLRLDVVIDRPGRDADVVGDSLVGRRPKAVVGESDAGGTQDSPARLGRVACWRPPDTARVRHAATVSLSVSSTRTVRTTQPDATALRPRIADHRWQNGAMEATPDMADDLSFDQLLELDRRADARAATNDAAAGDGSDGSDGTPVVLPWWQHPVNIITLVVTAAILAGMVGWMVGDSGSRIQHNEVDTGFLQDMRTHHEQAVLMGFIFRGLPDTDPGLRTISAGIVRGQSMEVGRMIEMLRDLGETEANETDTAMTWMGMSAGVGQMPGMASDDELEQLGRLSGEDADRLFVALMSEHHIGGIEMADFAAENAATSEVREMAAAMADTQRGEIVEMQGRLD